MSQLSLPQVQAMVAKEVPERAAIVWRGRALTHGQLLDRTRQLANGLRHRGLGRVDAVVGRWRSGQDHVAIVARNRPEWLEAFFGCLAARTVPCNINYRYVAAEMRGVFDTISPACVIYEASLAETILEACAGMPEGPRFMCIEDGSPGSALPGEERYESVLAAMPPSRAVDGSQPHDHYLLLTGGTTGAPKGVLWRQGDAFVAAMGGTDLMAGTPIATEDQVRLRVRPEARSILPAPPFMHGAAQWNAVAALLCGDTIVIQDIVDRLDPDDIWRTVEQRAVKVLVIIGNSFAAPLLDQLRHRTYDLGPLRVIISSAVTLSTQIKEQLLDALPGVTVLDSAGSSETGGQLANLSNRSDRPSDATFRPVGSTCILADDRTRVLHPDDHSVGWLASRGHVPVGYLNDEAATTRTFPEIDGQRFAIPGDRARWGAGGTIELLGRDSTTINSGGEKIYAEEVERAVLRHPGIKDVVVVGRPSERWGSEVVALIEVLDHPIDLQSVRDEASRHLAAYKVPKALIVVAAIKRGEAGKADQRWAQSIAESHCSFH